jgi:hypothetical protein
MRFLRGAKFYHNPPTPFPFPTAVCITLTQTHVHLHNSFTHTVFCIKPSTVSIILLHSQLLIHDYLRYVGHVNIIRKQKLIAQWRARVLYPSEYNAVISTTIALLLYYIGK